MAIQLGPVREAPPPFQILSAPTVAPKGLPVPLNETSRTPAELRADRQHTLQKSWERFLGSPDAEMIWNSVGPVGGAAGIIKFVRSGTRFSHVFDDGVRFVARQLEEGSVLNFRGIIVHGPKGLVEHYELGTRELLKRVGEFKKAALDAGYNKIVFEFSKMKLGKASPDYKLEIDLLRAEKIAARKAARQVQETAGAPLPK